MIEKIAPRDVLKTLSELEEQPRPLDLKDPFVTARQFLEERGDDEDAEPLIDLIFWNGDFYSARDRVRWESLSLDALEAELYRWLALKSDVDGRRVKPNKARIDQLIHALKAAARKQIDEVPTWLDASVTVPAHDFIAMRNGLLHIATRLLLPATRRFFVLNSLPFDFQPNADAPHWRLFLNSFEMEPDAISLLQEFFGYLLTGSTEQQKALLLIGPKRSGKSTLGRVAVELVGKANVAFPSLSQLGTQFGLAPLIGKRMALLADARLSGRSDPAETIGNILRITGEDSVTIDRKFQGHWHGRLETRFVVLTNELPKFLDQSGALASRFLIVKMTKTFFGAEDHGLTTRLLAELPGIFVWALEGLQRLRARGFFVQPQSSREDVQQLEALVSPINAFVADQCIVDPLASVECAVLFQEWRRWCDAQNFSEPGTLPSFGQKIAAALPSVRTTRPTSVSGTSERPRHYAGIRIRRPGEVVP